MKAAAIRIENIILSISPLADRQYKKTYSTPSLILMFFTFSCMGWVWEVFLHLISDGQFINRGVLTGPWLPIYGAGLVLILVVLEKWRDRPLLLAGLIMALCGTIEYITGLALESLFGLRWWNYSDMLFQIQGRVCLEGLIIFAFGGVFVVYLLAPKLDRLFLRLSPKAACLCCGLCIAIFALDIVFSFLSPNTGFGITSAISP